MWVNLHVNIVTLTLRLLPVCDSVQLSPNLYFKLLNYLWSTTFVRQMSLMPFVCTSRVVLWNMRGTLSLKAAPHGWWTPRNPSALSALSTRPPYSEWTPLPNDLSTWAWSHPSSFPFLLCAFHCDSLSGLEPCPPLSLFSHHLCPDNSSISNSYHPRPLFILNAKPPLDF